MADTNVARPIKSAPQISNHLRLLPPARGQTAHHQHGRARILRASDGCTTKPPTVFIVDDDPQLRGAIALLLDSVDIKAETFESADMFLRMFDPSRPGCVVLDVCMPGVSGLELARQLISRSISIPILMLTAHPEIAMEDDALITGNVDLIGKPFCQHVFLNWVRQAINRNR